MRDRFLETRDDLASPVSRPFDAIFHAASEDAPPQPAQMLTRLGLLLAVALGFGLVAQVLVGGSL